MQQFSTRGSRTPRGTQAVHRGYAGSSKLVFKIKKCPKQAHLSEIFELGVHKGVQSWFGGYAEEVNFDLGVRKYLKFENPCSIVILFWFKPFNSYSNSLSKTLCCVFYPVWLLLDTHLNWISIGSIVSRLLVNNCFYLITIITETQDR